MSKIITSTSKKVIVAISLFILLVVMTLVISEFTFLKLLQSTDFKYLVFLFGPVLSLGTHMSVYLFIPQAIPLVMLLVVGMIYPNTRLIVGVGFVATWFAIGWFMKDLF